MIRGYVFGDEEIAARFDRFPATLQRGLVRGITRAALRVQSRTKAQKLSGQVLNVRTGRLRRSINYRVEQQPQQVTGIVGTNVEYAGVHEFGFSGTVTIREHLRRTKSGRMATVRAHSAVRNLPARSFLRSSLRDLQPEIRAEIEASVIGANQEFRR